MKTVFKTLIACFALFALSTQPADAQFKNILKKTKKVLDDVTAVTEAPQKVVSAVNEVPIASGGTMINPFSAAADIELVGAYGQTTSMNYGEVYLVLKVKMNLNRAEISFGGNDPKNDARTMFVDQDGNSYLMKAEYSRQKFAVTEGLFVKVKMSDSYIFKDVKKTASVAQMIRLGTYINEENKGSITFKNVPIQWDVEPQ